MGTADTHLCARMSDEEVAGIPAQAAPIADLAIDTTGAAAVAPFREAFKTARQAFEAARPPSPAAPAANSANQSARPARAGRPARTVGSASGQLAPPDLTIPLIPDHLDVDMDDVVLHEEPEQIDDPLTQPNEDNINNAPGVEPPVVRPDEQDQQEENDSSQVDTAIDVAADAAAASALAQPTEASGPHTDDDEEDNLGDW